MSSFQSQPVQDVPNLLTHLRDEYALAAGADKSAEVSEFLRWAHAYLSEHRPVENFAADSNHGIRLSNNVRVLVCPKMEDLRGTTQDAGAVSINTGQSQAGQEGVSNTDSQRVI